MIIEAKSYPRAALIGNPSDGYHGRTIAFTFDNFCADITLYETPELEIRPTIRDNSVFKSIHHLAEDVKLYGYYGGIRLLKSAIKCFRQHCLENDIVLHDRNFTVRYQSTIPNLVGLAGSSAIITACMKALMTFYGVDIPKPRLANLIRSVETRELGIAAGLQDRVVQVYQGLVYMDFDKALFDRQGYGRYEPMTLKRLPHFYIAYRTDLSEGTEVFHNALRERYDSGDGDVHAAMRFWADLTDQARDAMEKGDDATLANLMNANFDMRAKLCKLGAGNLRMVEVARSTGASAKFTGSGGAIIGTYTDEAMYEKLQGVLTPLGIQVIKPRIV